MRGPARLLAVLLLVLAGNACRSSGSSSGSPSGGQLDSGACRAVGRLVWQHGSDFFDGTAVVHHAPPSSLFLRVVDPLGRPVGEMRTDGRTIRLTNRRGATYWESGGRAAMIELLGLDVTPDRWVAVLTGTGEAPDGWTVEIDDDAVGCLPRRASVESAGERIVLEWDAAEPWADARAELGPPPVGFRQVDSPFSWSDP